MASPRSREAVSAHGSTALVVSLGVDAAADDPNSPLRITLDGYRGAGEILRGLGLPTVIVQEGGYVLGPSGALVRAFVDPFARLEPVATRLDRNRKTGAAVA